MIAIFKKDFRSYFRSMQTFLSLALFSLFCGYYACRQFFLAGADGGAASTLLSGMCAAEALLLPLITMRSFAGERILHTDHLVLTAPIGPLSLAFGKFLACAALFLVSLVPAFILPLIIACMGYLSFGELFLVLLGCLLFGLAVAALGVFVSSMSGGPIGAYFGTLGILIVFWMAGNILPNLGSSALRALLSAIALFEAPEIFSYGILRYSTALYLLSFAAVCILLCAKSLDLERRTR